MPESEEGKIAEGFLAAALEHWVVDYRKIAEGLLAAASGHWVLGRQEACLEVCSVC
jgi:hypothetical protein